MTENASNDFSETAVVDEIDTDLLVSQSSMLEKMAERDRLNQEVEAFLAIGGEINHVDTDVMADPPKRPENKYGSHPI
jgi:2C-methyl-D-erythritol 2,4-cyclodiphosphate synthase